MHQWLFFKFLSLFSLSHFSPLFSLPWFIIFTRRQSLLIIVNLYLFVANLSPIHLHRKHRPLCLFIADLSSIHRSMIITHSRQSMIISLSCWSVFNSPIYDYLSLTPWVPIWAYFGGFMIWFWVVGLWFGFEWVWFVVVICLMVFCNGLVVVDGGWVWVLWFDFWVWVCDLILGLFLFVILVVGGWDYGQWWLWQWVWAMGLREDIHRGQMKRDEEIDRE